ncbi:tRNA 2-selenouridine(34) synthase MnmH [Bacillus massiliigorillae]|uniref:tRNA 2-selenouridine(34) synthase MnmH n=1 Tax=Bacillus massiliigorillae TaxID=1243664 RepID=UPI00039C23DB|nr:tRNA 2-selenouridine(34) synthase MnmH [Bacillus massiliigorillae]
MFQDITINELLQKQNQQDIVFIDVRSPSEFKDATIPGSINIPLFDDQERAEVGTLYKQVSIDAAKERGLEIVSAKLPSFVKKFHEIEGEKIVFCWRGGMRSKTTATVLSLMDIHVCRLHGGYREYRQWVVESLGQFDLQAEALVLNGYTGAGKTAILQQLHQEGYPVLDLEQMANHRGSIFGQIGLEPNNQKTFETLLLQKLTQTKQSPYILFEAESKRIGKVVLPPFFVEKKEKGIQIFIDMPIEERVRHILADYDPVEHKEACIEAFHKIKKRIHTPIAAQIEEHLYCDRFSSAVALLLQYYYDPLYEHTAQQYPKERSITIAVHSIQEAVDAIRELLQTKFQL